MNLNPFGPCPLPYLGKVMPDDLACWNENNDNRISGFVTWPFNLDDHKISATVWAAHVNSCGEAPQTVSSWFTERSGSMKLTTSLLYTIFYILQ